MGHLISVVGQTAIGKTRVSLDLAEFFNCSIISCDSRQFYREMRIGTAVPDEQELKRVPHHFIQSRSIHDDYSVGDFENDALNTLSSLFKNNDFAIMVGGSGLYQDAVLKGLDDFPKVASEIRTDLKQRLETEGMVSLQELLAQLDPLSYERIDIQNKQRLIRALEICIGTGTPYSSFLGLKKNERNFNSIKIGLTADRQIVYDRINERVDLMMNMGLLEEARRLYPYRKNNALQTVGYRELFAYLDGEWDLDTAVNEIKKNTRRFAKRQATWYRKDEEIHWFAHDTSTSRITDFIENQLKSMDK